MARANCVTREKSATACASMKSNNKNNNTSVKNSRYAGTEVAVKSIALIVGPASQTTRNQPLTGIKPL